MRERISELSIEKGITLYDVAFKDLCCFAFCLPNICWRFYRI